MPILFIEVVLREGESLDPGLAALIADRAGVVFESPPGHTWVRARAVAACEYAENGGGPDAEVHPVFVSVLKAHLADPVRRAAEAARLAEAVSEATGRPKENVHVIFEPAASGRIAFGGCLAGPDDESGAPTG